MTTVSVKVTGVGKLGTALDRTFLAALARNRKDALIAAGHALVAEVRRGSWFDNDRGRLKSQLFVGEPRLTKLSGKIDVGWGGPSAAYGPVLEPPGPMKKSWEIVPKNIAAGSRRSKLSKAIEKVTRERKKTRKKTAFDRSIERLTRGKREQKKRAERRARGTARKARAKKGGKPLKALRWTQGGRVVYAKRVTHKWSPRSLRPHFKPALERSRRKIDAIFGDAIDGAKVAAGLR